MPRYMLDTNMCIYLMKNQPESVARRFDQCLTGDVVMSAITYAELRYGVEVSSVPEKDAQMLESLIEDIPVMPFDELAAKAYGPIRLATRDKKSDHLDKLIAAHAVSMAVTLVTNNPSEYSRYPRLVCENWLFT
jgi:tRNA(fMet)-specific endonuclease VapC